MIIERRIHPNCSEWDSELEIDDDDYWIPIVKENIKKELESQKWDQ